MCFTFSFELAHYLSHNLRRLVQALLGQSAISERKLEYGNPLVMFGVKISVNKHGAYYQPSEDKVKKWTQRIQRFLDKGCMHAGEAQKLSGALQWASQSIFRRNIIVSGNHHTLNTP